MTIESRVKDDYEITITMNFANGDPTSWFKPVIKTRVPSLNFSTGSQWDAPLETGGDQINAISQLAGFGQSNQLKVFQRNVWTGSDPLEVSLDLQFVTDTDPVNDVVRPAMSLLLLTLPESQDQQGEDRWTLRPPVVRDVDQVAVRARGFEFPFVLPLDVDVDFSETFCTSPSSQYAWPVSADVSFSFIGSEAPSREEFGVNLNGINGNQGSGL